MGDLKAPDTLREGLYISSFNKTTQWASTTEGALCCQVIVQSDNLKLNGPQPHPDSYTLQTSCQCDSVLCIALTLGGSSMCCATSGKAR